MERPLKGPAVGKDSGPFQFHLKWFIHLYSLNTVIRTKQEGSGKAVPTNTNTVLLRGLDFFSC